MKKVVDEHDEAVVSIIECDPTPYYGVCLHEGTIYRRSFIMFINGFYTVVSTVDLTGTRSRYDKISLQVLIKTILNDGGKVYQFDTFKELSDWLNS